jgi:dGTP triphosphohydrolase
LTHTLEVSQIARTISKSLHLNEDLTEAIALGHDLGHTPFGHAGEDTLNETVPGGFSHADQSLRVLDLLEKDGVGLNLTFGDLPPFLFPFFAIFRLESELTRIFLLLIVIAPDFSSL